MKVFETTSYLYEKKKILKKGNQYRCLEKVIAGFFESHSTFVKVYESNYFVQSKAGLKIIKIRLPNNTMGKGKSGGYRMLIGCSKNTKSVALLTVYPKIGKLGKAKLEPGELPKVIKGFVNDFKNGKLKEYTLPDKKKR